ncbi:MAG: hypothetical protein JNM56_40400 [Planctomycetia bacterium]|nr:hypothetical protein [Planctomycetia bacterium]
MPAQPKRSLSSLPLIRGTQIGLREPAQVDRLKASMRVGEFAFHELDLRISGLRDTRGTYYVKDGHHRMTAALELAQETDDPTPVFELLRFGWWSEVTHPPNDARPMPARDWWGAFRNWLGW